MKRRRMKRRRRKRRRKKRRKWELKELLHWVEKTKLFLIYLLFF